MLGTGKLQVGSTRAGLTREWVNCKGETEMALGFKDMLATANAVIETVSVQDALYLIDNEQCLFVDVREAVERANGRIVGSIHVPRGFLEFHADPTSPMFNEALDNSLKLVLYCGSGGRSALSAKTLMDMGYTDVCHIAGGFAAWTEADGPVE